MAEGTRNLPKAPRILGILIMAIGALGLGIVGVWALIIGESMDKAPIIIPFFLTAHFLFLRQTGRMETKIQVPYLSSLSEC